MTCCKQPLILVPVAVFQRHIISFQLQPRKSTCLSQPPALRVLPSDQGDVRMMSRRLKALVCLVDGPQPKQRIGALLLGSSCRRLVWCDSAKVGILSQPG